MPPHLADGHTAAIEGEDLGVEALQPPLVLGDELGLEGPRPIARDGDPHRPGLRQHRFPAGPVAVIAGALRAVRVGVLGQMMAELRPKGALGQGFLQLGKEPILAQDVLGTLTAGQQLIE